MRTLLIALLASGCTNVSSTNGQVGITPGTMPSGPTPPPPMPAPSLAQAPMGMPAAMSTAPATPPAAPSDPKQLQTINVTIVNVIQQNAYQAPDPCSSLGLAEGQGYCSGDGYLTFCNQGSVCDFDCATYGSGVGCGYLDEAGTPSVSCMDKPSASIAAAVSGDVSLAYATDVPCSVFEEGTAACAGSDAFFCHDGTIYAQDCSLFVDGSGRAASCGVSGTGEIDCFFPE